MSNQLDRSLWCGNLPAFSCVNEEYLREMFTRAGTVEFVYILRNEIGIGNSAFITYRNAAEVTYALELFQGTQVFGQVILLRPSGNIPRYNGHLPSNNDAFLTTRPPSLQDYQSPTFYYRSLASYELPRGSNTGDSETSNDAESDGFVNMQPERRRPLPTASDNGQTQRLTTEQTSSNQSRLDVAQQPMHVLQERNSPTANVQNIMQQATSSQDLFGNPGPRSTQTNEANAGSRNQLHAVETQLHIVENSTACSFCLNYMQLILQLQASAADGVNGSSRIKYSY